MSIIVKIRKDNDIRRITIPRGTPFQELQKIASQLFSLQTPFVLKYRDDENDLITISNDIELHESLQFHKEGKPLNLEVFTGSNAAPTQNQSPHQSNDGLKFFENLVQQYQPLVTDFIQQMQTQATPNRSTNPNDNSSSNSSSEQIPIHNAFCDSCKEQIVGWRFKCQSCSDFDLCQLCIGQSEQVHDPSHQFTTIEKPERTFSGPWGGHCRRAFHPYANNHGYQWQ